MSDAGADAFRLEVRARNMRAAKLFGSELGAQVLADLEGETLELPVFRPAKISAERDLGPKDEALYAAWREGQNHLVRMIREKIRLGQAQKP